MKNTPNQPLPAEILRRCRELRHENTPAESLLWAILRNRGLKGAKFRRQVPVARYILDFYCHAAHLAVELDGGGHAGDEQVAYDLARTKVLEKEGIRLLRYWNHEVLNQLEDVLAELYEALPE